MWALSNLKKHGSLCRGFTLLEVMAAVSIIAIVLTAVYRLQIQTISMNSAARFYTIAPLLAQSRISELESLSEKNEGSESGDFGEDFPGYTWSTSIEDITSESEILGSVAEDLKKIEVKVSFNDDEYVYSFRTYRMMPDEG